MNSTQRHHYTASQDLKPERSINSSHRRSPDKADMHTQAAVDACTGKAYVHPIGHRCPCGVLGRTVKADLHTHSRSFAHKLERQKWGDVDGAFMQLPCSQAWI